MLDFLKLFVHVLVSPFKSQARLEAEIVVLRQQLMVLRRRLPSKPKLTVADRLLFVWLYRLFRSVLNAVMLIPEQAALYSEMMAPPIPINCRPAFRLILVHRSGMMAPGGAG